MIHGSSPLARGLPDVREPQRQPQWIIPARAGFTAPAACGDQRPKDHPRSRGVYHGRVDHVPDEGGSSPLARGLPGTRRSPPGRPTDHPRSRGVYVRMMTLAVGGAGSSPLARGLPIACPGRSLGCRIIPARAGFTWGRAFRAARCRDHPRSRGVYVIPTSAPVVCSGSSPLARGLPPVERSCPLRPKDHPRSRGVYIPSLFSSAAILGSSPLARGLPQSSWGNRSAGRIIPARAGFTGPRRGVIGAQKDHPRSRGVYSRMSRKTVPAWRIIPARAGFTSTSKGRPALSADHPRSRGVYGLTLIPLWRVCGSSPLARGLPGSWRPCATPARIIPARAGFTSTDRPRVSRCGGSSPLARGLRFGRPMAYGDAGDHPRSRGVYVQGGVVDFAIGGSSPLARGLLWVGRVVRARWWIIPARAGFTRK